MHVTIIMLLLFMYGILKRRHVNIFFNLLESLFGFASELREAVGCKAVDIWEVVH